MKPKSEERSRRRKERANVRKRLQGVYLRCAALAPKDLRVFNISELGVGVETAPIPRSPESGKTLEAKVLVGHTAAPVRIRLVHMTTEATGFEFVDPSELVRSAIRTYFESELAGAELRPAAGSSDSARRFKSSQGNTLEIQMEGTKLAKFAFEVMGNRVEWSEGGAIQLIQHARREPAPEFLLKQLVKLVQSADSLDHAVQQRLERVLQRLPQDSG